jgi:hypothetical protein
MTIEIGILCDPGESLLGESLLLGVDKRSTVSVAANTSVQGDGFLLP